MPVKKIALTIAAVSALGLAACQNEAGNEAANNMAGNDMETMNEADGDVGNATIDGQDAQNAANSALNTAAEAGGAAVNAVENVAAGAANAVDAHTGNNH